MAQCHYPMYLTTNKGNKVAVRCGRCKPCLVRKRTDKFIRLNEHSKDFKYTSFVTLTYDDEHLKWGLNPTLCKRDFQLFMKRLRKMLGTFKISYYVVGEYGTRYQRPHYHMIIFGLSRKACYKFIGLTWQNGLIHVGQLTERSINYVCKYHLLRGYNPEGTEKCFSLSSHYLGKSYVDKMTSWHNQDLHNRYFYQYYNFKLALPEYYKNKIYNPRIKELIVEKLKEKMRETEEDPKNFQDELLQKQQIDAKFEYKNLNNYKSKF